MKTIEQMYNEAKALVEDRRYEIGEISEKTGLQKTANGWVKPRNGKAPGAKTGPGTMPRAQKEAAISKESKPETRKDSSTDFDRVKENNAVKQWEESAKKDARNYKESMVIMQHPNGSVTAIRESSPDIEKAEYNGYEKVSLVRPDGSVKRKQDRKTQTKTITKGDYYREADKLEEGKYDTRLKQTDGNRDSCIRLASEILSENYDGEIPFSIVEGLGDDMAQRYGEITNPEMTYKERYGSNKAQQRAERDPKLMEELERSNRFEQEKMAKERQKKEDKTKQQRQEGEANARAFQEKVESGEIVYNKKSGQFEEGPKEKKSSSKSLKLPDEKSSFQTDVNRMKKLKNEDYEQYTIQLEKLHSKYPINKWKDLYNKTVYDSACRITADTKIKLKNVVEDKNYEIGQISEKQA